VIIESEIAPAHVQQAAITDHLHSLWLLDHGVRPGEGEAFVIARGIGGLLVKHVAGSRPDAGRRGDRVMADREREENRRLALASLAQMVAESSIPLDRFLSLATIGRLPSAFLRAVEAQRRRGHLDHVDAARGAPDPSVWNAQSNDLMRIER
jgi:hypothetical protein